MRCECECSRPASPEEQDFIDTEIGECTVAIAEVRDGESPSKAYTGVAIFSKLAIKTAVVADTLEWTEFEVREITEILARALRDFYVRTRLLPIMQLDDEDTMQ